MVVMQSGRIRILMACVGLSMPGAWPAKDVAAALVFPPPAPDGAETSPVPSPEVIWRRTVETYRGGTIGERIRISVTKPKPVRAGGAGVDADRLALEELISQGTDEQRGVVFLRMTTARPAGEIVETTDRTDESEQATSEDAPSREPVLEPVFRIEMGDLRVFGETGRLLAVRASVPGGVVIRTFDGPVTQRALDRMIPSLLLPPLAMVFDAAESLPSLSPGLGGPAWTTSQRVRESGKQRLILRGTTQSERGEHALTVTIDESTSRLVSMRIEPVRDGTEGEQSTIELFFSTIDAGDPASWRIDPAGRIEVASIDKLRSAPPASSEPVVARPEQIAAAGTMPALHLYNAQSEAWAHERSPAGRFAGIVAEDAGAFRVVMLLHLPVHTGDRQGRETLSRGSAAIRDAIARARSVAPDPSLAISSAGVAILELERFDDARRQAKEQWLLIDPSSASASSLPLLCSPAGRAMYGRFSSAQMPVIVVVDEKLVVWETIELDPSKPVPADLVERLSSILTAGV
jgi:hypothetical protein